MDKTTETQGCTILTIWIKKKTKKLFFKSRWIKEPAEVTVDGHKKEVILEQQPIVSYSIKHRDYQRNIRNRQVERALKALAGGAKTVDKKRQNDPKRFIRADHAPQNGEVADKTVYYIDTNAIRM